MADADCQVKRLTGTPGATVSGLDLSEPLDDACRAALEDGLATHRVLFLRDPHVFDDDAHLALPDHFPQRRRMRRRTVDVYRPRR